MSKTKNKSKVKNKRVVFATCLDKNENKDFKSVWDKIIKEELEEKYGKIK